MSISYKLNFIISIGALIIGAISTCEIFGCNYDINYGYTTSCTIEKVNCTEPIEFRLQNHHNLHIINVLKFVDSRISYIPHGIFQNLVNLQSIDLTDCHILEVVRYDFVQAGNLIEINLSHNDLKELNDLIFYGAVNVETINLSNNKIEHVSNNTFKALDSLKRINLSHNRIKIIGTSVFMNLTELRDIDLSENLFETLNTTGVYKHLNISDLNLSHNRIVTIDQRTFSNVKFIKLLNLNFNKIQHLKFNDVTMNIERISIVYNNLTILETNGNLRILNASINQLTNTNLMVETNLVQLSLIGNYLHQFDFIKNMSQLIHLDMSFNPIAGPIHPDTFIKLTQLKTLCLESVNLKQIDFQMFSELKQLTILDISYNDLESINFHKLSFLEKLTHLYINGNCLTQLAFDDFEFLFPNLNTIDISENNWMCPDLIRLLKRFKLLNIQIYIDEDRIVKNETNIRGIQCHYPNESNIANVSPKTPFIHSQPINTDFMVELNETNRYLNKLQKENDILNFELKQVNLILANITNATSYSNPTVDFTIYTEQITNKIVNITNIYSEQINKLNTQINMSIDRLETSMSGHDQSLMNRISNDLMYIKILLIASLVIGVIFGLAKMYQTWRFQGTKRPVYNTMAQVINEDNI